MGTAVTISPERFAQGMTVRQFTEQMSKNKELFQERYDNYNLNDAVASELRDMGFHLKALLLVEDWCGDVLRYVPVFARMAEAAGTWEVRLFCRDENLDLADCWRKNGQYLSIPVIVFFDSQMREVGCFVEKPASVYMEDRSGPASFAEQYSHLPDAGVPYGEMQPDTYSLYVEFIREFRATNMAHWQSLFVEEIMEKLRAIKAKV